MRRRLAIALALSLAAGATPAVSSAQSLGTGSVMDAVEKLQPGEFIWAPELAPAGPMLLIVNRQTQRLVVYRNGLPIGVSTVSTGKPGHRTPTGVFTILQKQVEHYSSLYDDAPMPFMQRLTWSGVALHGGTLPGYPASHGCIRLPAAFAEKLYGETRLGMTVVIVDAPALPRLAPAAEPAWQSGAPMPRDTVMWQPERAPSGPVTIVVSGADASVVVLRNGVEIGRAPARVASPITRPTAYALQSQDIRGRHWVRLPLPGQGAQATVDEPRQGVSVDPAFEREVLAAIAPGTTVLLTPDSMTALGAQVAVPLIESAPAPGVSP